MSNVIREINHIVRLYEIPCATKWQVWVECLPGALGQMAWLLTPVNITAIVAGELRERGRGFRGCGFKLAAEDVEELEPLIGEDATMMMFELGEVAADILFYYWIFLLGAEFIIDWTSQVLVRSGCNPDDGGTFTSEPNLGAMNTAFQSNIGTITTNSAHWGVAFGVFVPAHTSVTFLLGGTASPRIAHSQEFSIQLYDITNGDVLAEAGPVTIPFGGSQSLTVSATVNNVTASSIQVAPRFKGSLNGIGYCALTQARFTAIETGAIPT